MSRNFYRRRCNVKMREDADREAKRREAYVARYFAVLATMEQGRPRQQAMADLLEAILGEIPNPESVAIS